MWKSIGCGLRSQKGPGSRPDLSLEEGGRSEEKLIHRYGSVSPACWVATLYGAHLVYGPAQGSQQHVAARVTPGWSQLDSCHQEIFSLTDGQVLLAPCCSSGKIETVHKGEKMEFKKKRDFDEHGHNVFFLLSGNHLICLWPCGVFQTLASSNPFFPF